MLLRARMHIKYLTETSKPTNKKKKTLTTCPSAVLCFEVSFPSLLIMGAPLHEEPTIHQRPTCSAARRLSRETLSFMSLPPAIRWIWAPHLHRINHKFIREANASCRILKKDIKLAILKSKTVKTAREKVITAAASTTILYRWCYGATWWYKWGIQ